VKEYRDDGADDRGADSLSRDLRDDDRGSDPDDDVGRGSCCVGWLDGNHLPSGSSCADRNATSSPESRFMAFPYQYPLSDQHLPDLSLAGFV